MFRIGGLFSASYSLTVAQIQPALRHQLLLASTLADCRVNEKMRGTLLRLQSDKLDGFDLYKSCDKTGCKTIDQI